MKALKMLSIFAMFIAIVSCQDDKNSNVVSQKYVHKYGFDMTKDEWQNRTKEGTIITVLNNGITITNTYNNGTLHGPTTYTFPNSKLIEKIYIYDNGTLVKQIDHDSKGLPYKEEAFEPNNKKIITLWDSLGVPISIEQYENNSLVDGKYFKPDNEIEASIDNSSGIRIKRDRNGELLYKDKIENGILMSRVTFHSNGQIKSKMNFKNYELDGEQITYSPKGEILMTMTWKTGKLDGLKSVFRNNNKIAEIPYLYGNKHGVERHYNNNGELTMETHWENNKRHGSHRVYGENDTEIKWFYKGKAVSLKKFEEFSNREKLIANKEQYFNMIDNLDAKTAMQE